MLLNGKGSALDVNMKTIAALLFLLSGCGFSRVTANCSVGRLAQLEILMKILLRPLAVLRTGLETVIILRIILLLLPDIPTY